MCSSDLTADVMYFTDPHVNIVRLGNFFLFYYKNEVSL